jgi:prepilin-type N-terminal cleavage/methylation domain-containing protein
MSRQRGFSLAEMLFALLILSVVITTSLAVFVTRTKRGRQASELILVYQVLSNESEVVRRVDYANLDTLQNDFQTSTLLLRPLEDWKTAVDVSLLRPGVKRVKLTINWRKDQTASVTLLRSDTGGSNLW